MKLAIRKGSVLHTKEKYQAAGTASERVLMSDLIGEGSKGATTNTFQSTKWNQTQASKEGVMIMSHL